MKTKRLNENARIEVPHREGCFAVAAVARRDWPTPWALPMDGARMFSRRDKSGRSTRGYTLFLRFCCNDLSCPATLLLRNSAILALAEATR